MKRTQNGQMIGCKIVLLCICIIVIVAFTGCSGTNEPTDAGSLAKFYAYEFGVEPPLGVTNLTAKQAVVGDTGDAWLRFEANSNIITQIVSNRFAASDLTDFKLYSCRGSAPSWWKPEEDSLIVFYINNQWTKGSNYSIAVLGHDQAHHVVYFHHGVSF